jgi:ubiquinone/menaquinone biosynthesis C-methylase UbiE
MNLNHWNHQIIDFSVIEDFQRNESLSILANAVDYLNLRLAKDIPENHRVLEVGCGVQSLLLENLKNKSQWEGIDVFSENDKGVKTIATKIASVENIPFKNNSFDYVLSNQSIEHWREYGVSTVQGLSEISRVTSMHGKVVINFPIHLHGDKNFVKGDFKKIDKFFEDSGLKITKKTAVIDSLQDNYNGWRYCGFPDFYVRSLDMHEETSYVVEYEAVPTIEYKNNQVNSNKNKKIKKRQNTLMLNAHHGVKYLIWKFFNKLFSLYKKR